MSILISKKTADREIYLLYQPPHQSHTMPSLMRFRKLRHHGKRRHKKGIEEHRGKFVISHPIEERPASAANRSVRGHWEADTVVGRQGKACLVTLVDRKSRYLLGGKAISKTAKNTNGLLRKLFPKGKDITDTPEDYIQRKYHELNLRPRKCLGYKTPYEVYFSKVLHLA